MNARDTRNLFCAGRYVMGPHSLDSKCFEDSASEGVFPPSSRQEAGPSLGARCSPSIVPTLWNHLILRVKVMCGRGLGWRGDTACGSERKGELSVRVRYLRLEGDGGRDPHTSV